MKTIPKNFIEGSLESRRYAFLLDESNHFNSKNRSRQIVKGPSRCLYSPAHNNTEGCAIGRWLHFDLQVRLDRYGGVCMRETFYNLPEWMRELGQNFLADCQDLHDKNNFWCETGLSVDGEKRFRELVEEYCPVKRVD